MGYSNFDRKEKRKKDRRKRKYQTQQLSQVEFEMIRAEEKKRGSHSGDGTNSKADRHN